MSVLFSGGSDGLQRANALSNVSNSGPLTVSLWARPTGVSGVRGLVVLVGSNTNNNLYFGSTETGRLTLYQGAVLKAGSGGANPQTLNTWRFFAFTLDAPGTTARIYAALSGTTLALGGSGSGVTAFAPVGIRFGLGGRTGGERWVGQLEAAKVWPAMLSLAQLQAEMAYGPPQTSTNVAAWNLRTADAGGFADSIGNNDGLSLISPGVYPSPVTSNEAAPIAWGSHVGQIAGQLPSLTAVIEGTLETAPEAATGEIAGALPSLTAALVGESGYAPATGAVSSALPSFSASISGAAGAAAADGQLEASLPRPAMIATGAVIARGSASALLPGLAAEATGAAPAQGSATGSLPAPSFSASGQTVPIAVGSLVADLPGPSLSASGQAIPFVVASMAASVPGLALLAVGEVLPFVPAVGELLQVLPGLTGQIVIEAFTNPTPAPAVLVELVANGGGTAELLSADLRADLAKGIAWSATFEPSTGET